MKTKILFFFFYTTLVYSQLSELKQGLYSDEVWLNIATADAIIFLDEGYELIPNMVELYETKPTIVKCSFIYTIWHLEPDCEYFRIHEKTLELIDIMNNTSQSDTNFDILYQKVKLLDILHSYDDFSYSEFIFEIIQRDGIEKINPFALDLLNNVLYNLPQYEIEAKNVLLNVWENGDDNERSKAMDFLVEKYGNYMIDKLIISFQNDPYRPIKWQSMNYLIALDRGNANSLIKNAIWLENDWTFRIDMIDSLLSVYGAPSDLKFSIEYQITETNTTASSLMNYSIQDFIPPRSTISTSEMIQNLLVYCSELLEYGWITEENVYDEIALMIALIEENYHGQAVPELCSNLETYLGTVEDRFNESLITIEAYKFLFYHGNYIKDNVELEFGDCQ